MSTQLAVSHVMCVDNVGFEASLEKRKVYLCTADPLAAREGLLSVVDESGETYLYPPELFVAITIPEAGIAAFDEATA